MPQANDVGRAPGDPDMSNNGPEEEAEEVEQELSGNGVAPRVDIIDEIGDGARDGEVEEDSEEEEVSDDAPDHPEIVLHEHFSTPIGPWTESAAEALRDIWGVGDDDDDESYWANLMVELDAFREDMHAVNDEE